MTTPDNILLVKHLKTGRIYQVLGTCLDCSKFHTTPKPLVRYREWRKPDGPEYVREEQEFKDGRFEFYELPPDSYFGRVQKLKESNGVHYCGDFYQITSDKVIQYNTWAGRQEAPCVPNELLQTYIDPKFGKLLFEVSAEEAEFLGKNLYNGEPQVLDWLRENKVEIEE